MLMAPSIRRFGRRPTTARRTPDRNSHAVLLGAELTRCGRPVNQLHRFDLVPFNKIGRHLRCPRCHQLVQRDEQQPV